MLTNLDIFITTLLKLQQCTNIDIARMAQVVERMTGILKVPSSLLAFHILVLCVSLFNYAECDK
jgi:hypothetical protein